MLGEEREQREQRSWFSRLCGAIGRAAKTVVGGVLINIPTAAFGIMKGATRFVDKILRTPVSRYSAAIGAFLALFFMRSKIKRIMGPTGPDYDCDLLSEHHFDPALDDIQQNRKLLDLFTCIQQNATEILQPGPGNPLNQVGLPARNSTYLSLAYVPHCAPGVDPCCLGEGITGIFLSSESGRRFFALILEAITTYLELTNTRCQASRDRINARFSDDQDFTNFVFNLSVGLIVSFIAHPGIYRRIFSLAHLIYQYIVVNPLNALFSHSQLDPSEFSRHAVATLHGTRLHRWLLRPVLGRDYAMLEGWHANPTEAATHDELIPGNRFHPVALERYLPGDLQYRIRWILSLCCCCEPPSGTTEYSQFPDDMEFSDFQRQYLLLPLGRESSGASQSEDIATMRSVFYETTQNFFQQFMLIAVSTLDYGEGVTARLQQLLNDVNAALNNRNKTDLYNALRKYFFPVGIPEDFSWKFSHLDEDVANFICSNGERMDTNFGNFNIATFASSNGVEGQQARENFLRNLVAEVTGTSNAYAVYRRATWVFPFLGTVPRLERLDNVFKECHRLAYDLPPKDEEQSARALCCCCSSLYGERRGGAKGTVAPPAATPVYPPRHNDDGDSAGGPAQYQSAAQAGAGV